jgi:hypothetical protein
MPAIMQVEIGHVPFIEIPVPIRRLAPVVVSDLLPDLAGFAVTCSQKSLPNETGVLS